MKLKLDAEGHVVLKDGKPVYIDDDGKEIVVDAPQMFAKIHSLNEENKQHREAKQEAEAKLKIFDGIEDLTEYKAEADKAIETVANFNDKDFLKASEVENLKKQMTEGHEKELKSVKESFEKKENDYKDSLTTKDGHIRKLLISNKFAQSPLFSGKDPKTILTPDIAESHFGKNFKVEEKDGQLSVRAYYDDGQMIYSRSRAGEPANFDEGIEEVFDKYPGKDNLLRSKSGGGSADGSEHGDQGDKLTQLRKSLETETNPTRRISIKNQINTLEKQNAA